MLLYTRLAQPKVPKKRSRAGCNFCKEKKKKCDETRPSCGRCAENQQQCVYEPIKPRQRRKRGGLSVDTTTAQGFMASGPESARLPQQHHHEQHHQPQQQTPNSAAMLGGGLTIQQWDQEQRARTERCEGGGGGGVQQAAPGSVGGNHAGPEGDANMAATIVMPTHIQMPPDGMNMSDNLFTPWTPTDTAVFSPLTPSPFDFSMLPVNENVDDEIEEVIRRDSINSPICSSSQTTTSSSSLALLLSGRGSHSAASASASTTNPSSSPVLPTPPEPSPHLEFCHPAFAEFSQHKNRRALVSHFCNVLSHLIVFREENGNPFQQLVLPLSGSSPAVMDAIYALASAHLEFRGVSVGGEKSEYFHGRAIQELARLIEARGHKDRNELLAAIMLLVYYEVLVQRGRSNIVDGHLKGAMTIMENQEASTDPTGVFLERAFRFYDVIAALSFGTAPLSSAPGRGSLSPLPPLDSRGATSPSGSVDTLLGLATSLWPIIHRLSNLSSVKEDLNQAIAQGLLSKVAVLRTELETTTAAIGAALEQWQPVLAPSDKALYDDLDAMAEGGGVLGGSTAKGEQGRIQSILNNALAYRHSAFVYLYRVVRDYPRAHPLVQHHTHLSLTHCVGTVSHEGPMSALLWPLFVAACEATGDGDRGLARQAFVAIDRRQGMTNIERAWCIVQEVWRRADGMEREEEEEAAAAAAATGAMLLPPLPEDIDLGGAGVACEIGDEAIAVAGGVEEVDDLTAVMTGGGNASALQRRKSVVHVRHSRGVGGDLWRRVSRDMGVTIVFG